MRWHYAFYPTTLLEHAIAVTVVVFAIETVRMNGRLDWRGPFMWPALLLIVAAAIDVVAAPSRTAALGLFRAYFIEPVAFAFVLVHAVTSVRRAFVVLGGLAVAGVWVGAPNAVVVLQALRAHQYNVLDTPPVVIYTTANALALFLDPLIAIAAATLLYVRDRDIRAASAAFLIVAVPAMILTFSRGGYLAMAAVAVGLALSHRRRWWLLGGVIAAGVVLVLIPPIYTRVSVEFQNVGGTTLFGNAGRIALWKATLQMLQHYPIFGAGLAGFATRIQPYWNPQGPAQFIDPHNILLNFWVETGVLGVIAAAWLFVQAFRWSWAGWRRAGGPWAALTVGLLLACVAFVAHGLVDVPYFKNDLSLEFWVVIALIECVRRYALTDEPAASRSARGSRTAAPADSAPAATA
ncbi:MAG TPA: O-antigen ligase family protein [Candidatus Dormibacteraeota bacterium]|nr:O-antigen ligase family protein [Candidatus Dormibacteraeota bacterium]